MTVVLDGSALLAYLRQESAGEVVDGVLGDSVMASVNWAEALRPWTHP
jgi:PIN domain nuclease of toxin-antitoxin system